MINEQLDILAQEIGAVATRIERESALRIDAALADLRRVDAERELRLANLERAVADRLASVKDGIDGTPGRDGANGIDGKDGFAGRDGVDGKPGERGADGTPGRDGANGIDGKAGLDGADGKPGERGADGTPGCDGANGIDGKAGLDGADGTLPIAKQWSDEIHYASAVVAHQGSTYQAARDTGREPPHEDWICIAAAGCAGVDGRSFTVRGTFAAEVADYRALDVVALGGAAFVARRDAPGACPGEGWQLISSQGKRGNPGERGAKGDRGMPGAAIERMSIDKEGMLTLVNADGSTVDCDLYPLLAKVR